MTRYQNRIEINPEKMVGKPVIKGTRITVELILRRLAQGATLEEILRTYPHLKKQDILACLEYATHIVGGEVVFPLDIPRKRLPV